MVNIISQQKANAFHQKASLINLRCMQEKVIAMKSAEYKETNANSLSQDNVKTSERN